MLDATPLEWEVVGLNCGTGDCSAAGHFAQPRARALKQTDLIAEHRVKNLCSACAVQYEVLHILLPTIVLYIGTDMSLSLDNRIVNLAAGWLLTTCPYFG